MNGLDPLAVAVQGFGFGALLIAVQGFGPVDVYDQVAPVRGGGDSALMARIRQDDMDASELIICLVTQGFFDGRI